MRMGIFKRRRPAAPPAGDDPALRAAISRVVLLSEHEPAPPDPRRELLRIVSEAVILQDQAAELLAAIREREPLGAVAPRGGPLARRFFTLRRGLPAPVDGEMARQCETASVVLDHHGTLITYAMELLAAEWRSRAIGAQLERLDGLGAPADRLDALYAEL